MKKFGLGCGCCECPEDFCSNRRFFKPDTGVFSNYINNTGSPVYAQPAPCCLLLNFGTVGEGTGCNSVQSCTELNNYQLPVYSTQVFNNSDLLLTTFSSLYGTGSALWFNWASKYGETSGGPLSHVILSLTSSGASESVILTISGFYNIQGPTGTISLGEPSNNFVFGNWTSVISPSNPKWIKNLGTGMIDYTGLFNQVIPYMPSSGCTFGDITISEYSMTGLRYPSFPIRYSGFLSTNIFKDTYIPSVFYLELQGVGNSGCNCSGMNQLFTLTDEALIDNSHSLIPFGVGTPNPFNIPITGGAGNGLKNHKTIGSSTWYKRRGGPSIASFCTVCPTTNSSGSITNTQPVPTDKNANIDYIDIRIRPTGLENKDFDITISVSGRTNTNVASPKHLIASWNTTLSSGTNWTNLNQDLSSWTFTPSTGNNVYSQSWCNWDNYTGRLFTSGVPTIPNINYRDCTACRNDNLHSIPSVIYAEITSDFYVFTNGFSPTPTSGVLLSPGTYAMDLVYETGTTTDLTSYIGCGWRYHIDTGNPRKYITYFNRAKSTNNNSVENWLMCVSGIHITWTETNTSGGPCIRGLVDCEDLDITFPRQNVNIHV